MSNYLPLRSLLAVSASAVALTAVAQPAFAQTATVRPASAAAEPATIEELVVTAEKREQSLQEVPVAVTAYTSERRTLLGANTVEDIARLTPSLSYTNNDRLSIRGMGRLTNSIGTDPSVALYSDGVFSNSMADASTPPLFIERTEILRGPQGTLYGRNSIGGTLNVISKRPTEDFEGEVRGAVGNFGSWRTDALVRGPITDHLRFLLGGSVERRDEGFIKNVGPGGDTGAEKRWMFEAQVEADLGEHVVARLRYSKFDWDDSYGVGNTLFNVISPIDTRSLTGAGNQALYYNPTFGYTGTNPAVNDPYKTNTNDTATGKLSDHHRLQADVTWDLGGATLKYLGGFQTYVYDTTGDADQSPRTAPQNIPIPDLDGPGPLTAFTATNVSTDARTFYEERQKWYSNELNLSSSGDGPLQWIVGVFQYQQNYDQPQGIRVVGDPSMFTPLTLAGTPSAPNPRGAYLYVDGHLNSKSYAGFGQIDYKFTPEWTLTAGLRYTKDEKTGYDIARYVARLPTLAAAFAAAGIPLSVGQAFAVDITTLQVCGTTTLAGCAANPTTANLFANPGGGLRRNLSGDWDAWTGTLGIKWEPDSDTNIYARYSRGYKSGGWLGSNGLTPDPYADPEHVDAYELGVKKNIGRTLQANASLYYDDYKGFQTPLTVPLGTITASQFLNLNARIWGFEFEGQWAPIDHLQIYASYAYLNTEVRTGCCYIDTADPTATGPGAQPSGARLPNGSQPQTLVGNSLPLSPRNKFTIGANYTFDLGASTLTVNGTVTHTDDQQSTIWNNPIYTSPANDIADFRAIWRPRDSGLTVIASVKNAFDEVAYQSSLANPAAITAVGYRQQVILNYPRTYGMELQYKF
jgi:iron complex outermembrane receptor protein